MILASTPASTPDGTAPDPDLVTPGTIGFLVTLAVVIVVIFLIRDALRRVRRVRARSGTSDAYPIPLRRHVVPNQSTLSGPEEPEAEDTSAEAAPSPDDDAGSSGTKSDGTGAESEGTEGDGTKPDDADGSDTRS
jgi:hypothetical protein